MRQLARLDISNTGISIINYSRNLKDYNFPNYWTYIPVEKPCGYYLESQFYIYNTVSEGFIGTEDNYSNLCKLLMTSRTVNGLHVATNPNNWSSRTLDLKETPLNMGTSDNKILEAMVTMIKAKIVSTYKDPKDKDTKELPIYMLLNPRDSRAIATSHEFLTYLRSIDPYNPILINKWGLMTNMYGINVIVDETVDSKTMDFVIPNGTLLFVTHDGKLEKQQGELHFNTLAMMYYNDEMTCEKYGDKRRATQDVDYRVVCPSTGFLLTNSTSSYESKAENQIDIPTFV